MKKKEIVMPIAQNNKFNKNGVDKVINTMQMPDNTTICNTPENKEYVTFIYAVKQYYHVTKVFKKN
jgi:hypothetical protein